MLKILVIGNGFDKAHGLKTGYTDFLSWYQNMYSSYDNSYRGGLITRSLEDMKQMREFQKENPDEFEETISAHNNFWMMHFFKVENELGGKWLDFESEIEKLVKHTYNLSRDDDIRHVRNELRNECGRTIDIPEFVNVPELFQWLNTELRQLTRVLEIYLCKYVNKSINKEARMDLFTEIKPNKLISFNYTSTYQDIYNFGIQTDYIHGRANIKHSQDNCPLVLGFDDHYFESSDTIMELIPFEKYYQRIVYRNSNDYFLWLDSKNKDGEYEEKTVYFYGHSLSPADGDIIKLLIESENTKTKIYYRKAYEEERANMIKKLAIILTPNGLIRRIGGKNPTIELIPV